MRDERGRADGHEHGGDQPAREHLRRVDVGLVRGDVRGDDDAAEEGADEEGCDFEQGEERRARGAGVVDEHVDGARVIAAAPGGFHGEALELLLDLVGLGGLGGVASLLEACPARQGEVE